MVYNTGNGASPQKYQINHKFQEKDVGNWEKESKTLNTFQKIL